MDAVRSPPARPKHTDPGTGFMRPDARALHGAVSISIEPSRRVSRRVVATMLAAMQLALRRRQRMPFPICRGRCGPVYADLGRKSTDSATTHSLDPACSLGAPRYNEYGYASRAKLSMQQWHVHCTNYALYITLQPRRCGHLRSDARWLRAVPRCGTGIHLRARGNLRTTERRKVAAYPELGAKRTLCFERARRSGLLWGCICHLPAGVSQASAISLGISRSCTSFLPTCARSFLHVLSSRPWPC